MEYAVNVGDLTKDTIIGSFLVMPMCPSRTIVDCEPGRIDGGAVLLEVDEGRAVCAIATIRIKHPGKNLMRVYASKTGRGGWKRVSDPWTDEGWSFDDNDNPVKRA